MIRSLLRGGGPVAAAFLLFLGSTPARPTRAQSGPAASESASGLDQAVELMASRARLESLQPDNFKDQLAPFVGEGVKWQTTEGAVLREDRIAPPTGPVQQIVVEFSPSEQKTAKTWAFSSLVLEMRTSNPQAALKEMTSKLSQRLGKPVRGKPNGDRPADVTWSLKDTWTAHAVLVAARKGKPAKVSLWTTKLSPENPEGE